MSPRPSDPPAGNPAHPSRNRRNPLKAALRRAADKREPATVLACIRIALGVALLFTLWLTASSEALAALWHSPENGGFLPVRREHWLFAVLPQDETAALQCVVGITTISGVAVTLGALGRASLLTAQQALVALSSLNPDARGGYDTLLSTGLLVLAFSGCTKTISVDCWLQTRRLTSNRLCYAWPRYALIVQLLLMYGFSGAQKVALSWTPLGGYGALYYVLADPTWVRVDWGDPRIMAWPLAAGTALTWHWEQLAPLLLCYYYFRATPEYTGRLRTWCGRHDPRMWFALVGLGLHLGIMVLLDVGPFSVVALCYYLCLWSPNDWARMLRRRSEQSTPRTAHG